MINLKKKNYKLDKNISTDDLMEFFDAMGLPRQLPIIKGQNDPSNPGGESTLEKKKRIAFTLFSIIKMKESCCIKKDKKSCLQVRFLLKIFLRLHLIWLPPRVTFEELHFCDFFGMHSSPFVKSNSLIFRNFQTFFEFLIDLLLFSSKIHHEWSTNAFASDFSTIFCSKFSLFEHSSTIRRNSEKITKMQLFKRHSWREPYMSYNNCQL